ncbi:hypothetical protein AcW1_009792 [Taiwanofungus camphoratus]|nr:hypothetical protein AcV5_002310 [Antrodia cinnamomea]KAI0941843.1 hypothetical protein AcV7_002416 [Antrodia cinnamomea]KAI0948217.1 hypothetical protein AcW1_009792 [Antrodia cinnamomea]KAI0948218.1 hypothetical protein AcW1_009792 [Antrodia cinnamomea]
MVNYFGYLLDDAWIVRRGVRLGLGTNETPEAEDTTYVRCVRNLMYEAEIGDRAKLVTVIAKGKCFSCIALASTDPRDGMPPHTQDDIERLKTVLKKKVQPKWWPYA